MFILGNVVLYYARKWCETGHDVGLMFKKRKEPRQSLPQEERFIPQTSIITIDRPPKTGSEMCWFNPRGSCNTFSMMWFMVEKHWNGALGHHASSQPSICLLTALLGAVSPPVPLISSFTASSLGRLPVLAIPRASNVLSSPSRLSCGIVTSLWRSVTWLTFTVAVCIKNVEYLLNPPDWIRLWLQLLVP